MDSVGTSIHPFFQSGGADRGRVHRLILLSPHFPPGQTAGALRWQKLSRFVAERGWGVDAITLDPASLPAIDASRLADLPPGVRIYGVPPQKPALERIEKALLKMKRRFPGRERAPARAGASPASVSLDPAQGAFAPDDLRGWPKTPREWSRAYEAAMEYARDGAWSRVAAALAERLFDPERHRLIVSCGPPCMTHEGGRRAAETCALPLVVDMRDPWRLVERLTPAVASPIWRFLSQRYEPRVIERASLVVMNTPQARDAMRRLYPAKAERVMAVLNGWDEEAIPMAHPDGRFLVVFAGSIYVDRDPRPFFRAAGRVVRELRLSPGRFAIEFLGHADAFGGVPTAALAAAEGLGAHFRLHRPAPRRDAMELQARASMLLDLPQSLRLAIPSKIYDYMRFPAWVLSLSEPDSATGWLLGEVGAHVVPPHDVDAIARVLRECVLEHGRGVRPDPLAHDPRFSRRAQAERLFGAIERTVCARTAQPPLAEQ